MAIIISKTARAPIQQAGETFQNRPEPPSGGDEGESTE
jgi:hypothetical protein